MSEFKLITSPVIETPSFFNLARSFDGMLDCISSTVSIQPFVDDVLKRLCRVYELIPKSPTPLESSVP